MEGRSAVGFPDSLKNKFRAKFCPAFSHYRDRLLPLAESETRQSISQFNTIFKLN